MRAGLLTLFLGSFALFSPGADLAPSQCQLSGGSRTLGQALDELTRQSGIAIDQSRTDRNKPCPAAFDAVPFWDALERTAAAAGQRVVVGQQGVALVPNEARKPAPVSVAGAFRVAMREAVSRLDFVTGRASCDLTLDVNWEPKVHLFLLGFAPKSLTASAGAGNMAAASDALGGRAAVRGNGAQLVIRLDGVNRQVPKLTRLQGRLSAVGTQRYLEVEFPVKELGERREDGVTVRLESFGKRGTLWQARVSLKYATMPEFESFQSWSGDNRITLRGPGGATFTADDQETVKEQRGEAVINYFFKDAGKGLSAADLSGWAIVYRTPGKIVEVEVPFEFRDVDLP